MLPMVCECTSSTKCIKIISSKATPTENDNLEDILDKKCQKDTGLCLVSKGETLIVHLEFDTAVVTAVEVFSNFKYMKIFFSEVSLRDYMRRREANSYDLKTYCEEYRCRKSAFEMSLVFEEGSELYFLKVKGNAPGITQAVDTKYELMSSDKFVNSNSKQGYHIGQ